MTIIFIILIFFVFLIHRKIVPVDLLSKIIFYNLFTKICQPTVVLFSTTNLDIYIYSSYLEYYSIVMYIFSHHIKKTWSEFYRFMVFKATFNNISVISWRSVMEKNNRPVTSHWQTLSHNVVSSTPRHERGSN
jgi:hypothetical protein